MTMSTLKSAAIALVGGIAGAALWHWLADDPQVAVPKVQIVEKYVIAPPSAQAEPEIGPSLNAGTSPSGAPVQHSDLGRQLQESKDLKAFVVDALKRPKEGGAFYAALALRECSRGDLAYMKAEAASVLQKVSAQSSTVTTAQMAAINAAADRCVNFSDGEVTAYANEIGRVRKDDPLLQLQAQSMARDPEQRAKAVTAILATGNLSLMSEARLPTSILQASMERTPTGLVYRYDGKTYSDESAQRAIDNGAWLATCGAGPCEIDREMRVECVAAGNCYGSREEYLRQQVFKDDPRGFEQALRMSEAMRAALVRGDTSIFK